MGNGEPRAIPLNFNVRNATSVIYRDFRIFFDFPTVKFLIGRFQENFVKIVTFCGDHHFVDKLALNTVHPKAMGRRETKWQVKHVHIGLVTVPHSSSFGDSAIRRAGRWEYLTPRRGDGRSDLGTWCPRVVACLTPPP